MYRRTSRPTSTGIDAPLRPNPVAAPVSPQQLTITDMDALHLLAVGAAMGSWCCLALSPDRRDRRAGAVSAIMAVAMIVGVMGGSLGLLVSGIVLVAAAPIAVMAPRTERSRGLHRALGALAMGALMIVAAGHGAAPPDARPETHSHSYGVLGAVIVGMAVVAVLANLGVLVHAARSTASRVPLAIAGEAFFMVAGMTLMGWSGFGDFPTWEAWRLGSPRIGLNLR